MPYETVFTKSFQKEFRKLPKFVQGTIIKNLEKTTVNPFGGKKLSGKLEGLWRYRQGKYRLIYMIDEKNSAVVFLDVGLRKAIYE